MVVAGRSDEGSRLNSSGESKPGLSAPTAPDNQPSLPIGGGRGMLSRLRAYRLLWGIALAIFVADQATKFWIVARVPFDPLHSHGAGNAIEVIGGFFYIIHVGNTGAAWSMFTGRSVVLA